MEQDKKDIISHAVHIVLIILVAFAAFNSRFTTPVAQMQSAPTVTDLPVINSPQSDPRNETAIAVSRSNPQVIVGASKWIEGGASGSGNARVAYYFSSDGGHTWGNGVLPLETPQKTWTSASKPSLVSDLDGNFYLCALFLDSANRDTGVYIFKSTDAGHTFASPVAVALDIGSGNAPKSAKQCHITVDTSPSSPFKNTLYAVWVSDEPSRTVVLTNHQHPGD
ncbi:MAG: repeat-like domain [Blastocatellia bacterium]